MQLDSGDNKVEIKKRSNYKIEFDKRVSSRKQNRYREIGLISIKSWDWPLNVESIGFINKIIF